MKETHGFDLEGERHRLGLDFYQTITLVNYIRRQTMMSVCFSCLAKKPQRAEITESTEEEDEDEEEEEWLVKHLKEQPGCGAKVPSMEADFWKDAQFLLPILENDPLLMLFGEEESDDNPDVELERSSDTSDNDSDADEDEDED
jgi:hypothetical protein